MLELDLEKRAVKYLHTLPPKHARQIAKKIQELRIDPEPHDSKQLTNSMFKRADVGEHRIVYIVTEKRLVVPLIGKRNDGDVYRKLDRLQG